MEYVLGPREHHDVFEPVKMPILSLSLLIRRAGEFQPLYLGKER